MRGASSIATDSTLADICPYKRLLAAVFTLAAADAKAGDSEAREWMNREGAAIASLLIPTSVDPVLVVQRLMQRTACAGGD